MSIHVMWCHDARDQYKHDYDHNHLLNMGLELGGVGVVAPLHGVVHTLHHRLSPGNIKWYLTISWLDQIVIGLAYMLQDVEG